MPVTTLYLSDLRDCEAVNIPTTSLDLISRLSNLKHIKKWNYWLFEMDSPKFSVENWSCEMLWGKNESSTINK